MQSEVEVGINAPIDVVFDVATNRVAEWSIVVVEDEVLNEAPEGVGTTFRIVTEERGRRMDFDGLVTGHQPPTFSAVTMVGKSFDIDAEYHLEDLGGKTRLVQKTNVEGKGLMKVMFFLMGFLMKKSSCDANNKELVSLKALAESEAAGA